MPQPATWLDPRSLLQLSDCRLLSNKGNILAWWSHNRSWLWRAWKNCLINGYRLIQEYICTAYFLFPQSDFELLPSTCISFQQPAGSRLMALYILFGRYEWLLWSLIRPLHAKPTSKLSWNLFLFSNGDYEMTNIEKWYQTRRQIDRPPTNTAQHNTANQQLVNLRRMEASWRLC